MKKMKHTFFHFSLFIFHFSLIMVACGFIEDEPEWEFNPGPYTNLILNRWANGSFTLQSREQWFRFTATTSNQFIHLKAGTIDSDVYVEPYNKKGEKIANAKTALYNPVSFPVSIGTTYFIKVYPVLSATTGTYQIGVTNTEVTPDTLAAMAIAPTLSAGTWADGSFTLTNREEWFMFTATSTAPSQYIHLGSGTVDGGLYIKLHDRTGLPLENGKALNVGQNTQPTVTIGTTYFIKVYPVLSSTIGTYKIAFNSFPTAPALNEE
jgi:hypothetical protein